MWADKFKQAGTRLQMLRKREQLSISKLEQLSHIDESTLRKIESGDKGMTVRNAIKLAPILNTTPVYLLFEINDGTPQ